MYKANTPAQRGQAGTTSKRGGGKDDASVITSPGVSNVGGRPMGDFRKAGANVVGSRAPANYMAGKKK